MADLNPGDLRHVVLIETYAVGTDGAPVQRGSSGGMQPHNWSTFATIRASINPATGQERIGAATINPRTTHKVTTRYYPGITTAMRMTDACGGQCPFSGKSFDIVEMLFTTSPEGSNRVQIDFEVIEGRAPGNV